MDVLNNKPTTGKPDFGGQNGSQKSKKKKFYISLAVFIATLSVAGWATYASVQNFTVSPQQVKKENLSQNNSKSQNKIKPKNSVEKESTSEETVLEKTPIPIKKEPQKKSNDVEAQDEQVQAVSAENIVPEITYPTNNVILKEFSDGKPVYSKTMGDWRSHQGVDFKCDTGSIVKAITSGIVKDIYEDSALGVTIVIEHDTKFTAYYSGLSKETMVKKGEKVKSGQDIGSVDKVPCEILEEPHLHLMIYKEDKIIDPILILEKDV